MNINNLKIDLTLSINGAKVSPTVGQFDQIKKFIANTIFSESTATPVKKLHRYSKRRTAQKWSDDEKQALMELVSKGYTYKRIASMLNQVFNNNRTPIAVNVMLSKKNLKKSSSLGILDKVMVSKPPVEDTGDSTW